MLQHLIVMNAGALLLAVAFPLRPSSGRVLALMTALQVIALGVWHAQNIFQAAHHSLPLYLAMQASLAVVSFLFWCAILGLSSRSAFPTIAALLITAKAFCLLGAILAFSRRSLYAFHGDAGAWDLSPIEDQQLAGLFMMVSCAVVYVAAAVTVFTKWLSSRPSVPAEQPWMYPRAADAAH